MTERLLSWFSEYSADHQTRGNEFCHYFGVPLVALSVLGFLHPFHMTASLLAAALVWYFYLDAKLALAFLPVALGLYWLAGRWDWRVYAALFVAGWAFQFFGHYVFERRPPAFTRNPLFLLIGPFWVFAKLLGPLAPR